MSKDFHYEDKTAVRHFILKHLRGCQANIYCQKRSRGAHLNSLYENMLLMSIRNYHKNTKSQKQYRFPVTNELGMGE